MRLKILKPYTIGLISRRVYTCHKYSKEAMIRLHHMEQTDGVEIKQSRNGREYKLLELPYFIVDEYFPETNSVYKFFGFFWHGHHSQPFRFVITTNGDTLEIGYKETMLRFEQIARVGCQVKVQRECEFDDAGIDIPKLDV